MEAIISEATGQGLQLGAAAVKVCARYARHTCCTPALVSAWQMFRAVPPRARSALVYSEMMVRACLLAVCIARLACSASLHLCRCDACCELQHC